MPETPPAAVQAAASALSRQFNTCHTHNDLARIALEAVAPLIAEHIAQRVEASCAAYSHSPEEIHHCPPHNAGRLIREAFPKGEDQ